MFKFASWIINTLPIHQIATMKIPYRVSLLQIFCIKLLLVTLISVNPTTFVFGTSIGLGFKTDKISVWRYWEKTEHGFKNKILVFNVSDNTLEFMLQQDVLVGFDMKKDTSQTKIIVNNTMIESLDYIIFEIDSELTDMNNENNSDKIFIYYLNGKSVGASESEYECPPLQLQSYKYISCSGLNSSTGSFWMAKNNLFSNDNLLDSILLIYRYIGNPFTKQNEQYCLILQPTNNFLTFEVLTNGIQKGYYNNFNYYEIRIPNATEISDETTTQIKICFKALKKAKTYLGVSCSTRIITNKSKELEEKDKSIMPAIFTLPILIR